MIEFEKEFARTNGQPFERNGNTYCLAFPFDTGHHTRILVDFVDARPAYRQGVRLDSEQAFHVAGKVSQAVVLWHDTAPKHVECNCAPHQTVRVWNVWDTGDGAVHSWHNGAAMIVEAIGEAMWRFNCNDGHPDEACDDMVFTIRLE